MVTAQSPPVKNAPTDTVFLAMVNPVNSVIRVHHVLIVPNAEIARAIVTVHTVVNVLLTVTVHTVEIVLNAEIVLIMGIALNVQNDPAMEIVQIVLETQIEILHAPRGPIDLLLIDQHMAIVGIEMVVPIVEATPAVDLRVPLEESVRVTTGDSDLRMVIDRLDQNALVGQIGQTGLNVAGVMTAAIVLSVAGVMTAMHVLNVQIAPRIVIVTAPLLDIPKDRASGRNVLVLRNESSPNKSYLPAGFVGFAPTTLILKSMMMSLTTCSIKAQGMNSRP